MNSEIEKIFERYKKRKEFNATNKNPGNHYYNHYSRSERELKYSKIIKNKFDTIDQIKLMEVGAGFGGNLLTFKRIGLEWEYMHANELLPERFERLKKSFPGISTYQGDACELDISLHSTFDIVLQSTVFTSILDSDFKEKLANKMWSLLKPQGIILWYDFAFDNPENSDVKGIKRREIKSLFNESKNITFYRTTLAPPIGRRVKNFYPYINFFPFLRTHLIAVIEK